MEENFRNIYKAIQEADALLIGASNGLSISEGYNIFADDHWFQKDFGDFRSRYGIRNILQGLFFQYPTEESKWAFFSRLISRKCYLEQPGPVGSVSSGWFQRLFYCDLQWRGPFRACRI